MTRSSRISVNVLWATVMLSLMILVIDAVALDTDKQYVRPGTPFFIIAPVGDSGGATGYEWQLQPSGAQWSGYAEGQGAAALTVTDTYAAREAGRYRVRGYVQGWACDSTGCHELGDRLAGPWSDPSAWAIGVQVPGACGVPVVSQP